MTDYDWQALERSPEFHELVRRKRRFVVPATIGFLAWYVTFVLLAGYAEDFMGRELLFDGITVGYGLALSQFLMVWGLTWLYLRKAEREFDPLEARVRAIAEGAQPAPPAEDERAAHGAGTGAGPAAPARPDVTRPSMGS
jgi:uncharacterized membrane protein (DUF485 family)